MTSKSVLISIQPKWVAYILNGKKSKEIRKTKPTIATPFKCYIYCTKNGRPLVYGCVFRGNWYEGYVQTYGYSKKSADEIWGVLNGKVVGEFVCDKIDEYKYNEFGYEINEKDLNSTMLTANEFLNYGKQETLYGLNISELKIYDQPKELSEFYTKNLYTNIEKMFTDEKRLKNGLWVRPIKRPPQSWCYVEALEMEEE